MSACLSVVWLFALLSELDNFGCQRCVSAKNYDSWKGVAVIGTNTNATGHVFCSAGGRNALLDSRGAAAFLARASRPCAWQVCSLQY